MHEYKKTIMFFCLKIDSIFFQKFTAIPYRDSTGPEQGFPCEPFLTGKTLFSLEGTPVLIAGTLFTLQGFPCEIKFTGKNPVFITGNGFAVWVGQLEHVSPTGELGELCPSYLIQTKDKWHFKKGKNGRFVIC